MIMKDILCNELYLADIKKIISKFHLNSLYDKKRFLITGGLGLICSGIVDILHICNTDYNCSIEIDIADINDVFYKDRYQKYNDINFYYYNSIENICFNKKYNYIIHGAGIASPNLYIEKPVETMLSNINGIINLLEYSVEKSIDRILYISSSEVYGNKLNDKQFSEDEMGISKIDNVRNSYSESKRASEVLCKSFSEEYGIDTVIVRPGHIFGPTASIKDKRLSSDFMFKSALGEKLVLKSSGIQQRSYCYSLDCAAAILLVLFNGEKGKAYNIGSEVSTSIIDLSRKISYYGNVELIYEKPSNSELMSFNPMNNSSLNIDRIKELGYSDTFSIDEAVEHTIKIIKNIYE